MSVDENKKHACRRPTFFEALFVLVMIIALMMGLMLYGEAEPHIALSVCTIFVCLYSMRLGLRWNQMESAMVKQISSSISAMLILLTIGILIGVWMITGVVPGLIYYGLYVLRPSFFLVSAMLLCALIAYITGSSWGTAGTIGIALVGIGVVLKIPAPLAAGAVISGCYTGDKLSPVSDTTLLAATAAGADLFSHAKYMLASTGITFVLAGILYFFLGFPYVTQGSDLSLVNEIQSALSMQFHIGLPLFIPPVLVIFLIGKKVNSLPALWAGIFSAILFGLFSGQCGFHELLQASYYGFQSQTGNELLDNLLSKGGMDSVYYGTVICFIIMAMSGVLEEAGFTEVIAKATVGKVKKSANLIGLTLLTSFFVNFVMADQYIRLVLPGRMLAEEYKRRGLAPKVLANALESGGTVTSCLVPWSTCGVFMATTFGIATVEYAPYVLMGILSPIVLYILSLLHLKIAYVQESAHL